MDYMNSTHSNTGQPIVVTLQMVRSRTVELAKASGRSSIEIRQRDYEQAKRELTGETDFDRQYAVPFPGQ